MSSNEEMADDIRQRLKRMMDEVSERSDAIRLAQRMVNADKNAPPEALEKLEKARRDMQQLLDRMGGAHGKD